MAAIFEPFTVQAVLSNFKLVLTVTPLSADRSAPAPVKFAENNPPETAVDIFLTQSTFDVLVQSGAHKPYTKL